MGLGGLNVCLLGIHDYVYMYIVGGLHLLGGDWAIGSVLRPYSVEATDAESGCIPAKTT